MKFDKQMQVIVAAIVLIVGLVVGFLVLSGDDEELTEADPSVEFVEEQDEAEEERTAAADTEEELVAEDVFNEAVSGLALDETTLDSFLIYSQNQVSYTNGTVTTYAYAVDDVWAVASSGAAAPACSELSAVPEEFRPACLEGEAYQYGSANANDNYEAEIAIPYL